MKACYEDETLNVSKEAFEEPLNLSINVDCDKVSISDVFADDNSDEDLDELDF